MSNSIYGEDIAVLKDQMKDVKDALTRIEANQLAQAGLYATKTELKSFKYITVPMVIIVTAVITGLVYFYISHGKTLNTPDIQNNTVSSSPAPTSPAATTPASSNTGGVQVTVPKAPGVN